MRRCSSATSTANGASACGSLDSEAIGSSSSSSAAAAASSPLPSASAARRSPIPKRDCAPVHGSTLGSAASASGQSPLSSANSAMFRSNQSIEIGRRPPTASRPSAATASASSERPRTWSMFE